MHILPIFLIIRPITFVPTTITVHCVDTLPRPAYDLADRAEPPRSAALAQECQQPKRQDEQVPSWSKVGALPASLVLDDEMIIATDLNQLGNYY